MEAHSCILLHLDVSSVNITFSNLSFSVNALREKCKPFESILLKHELAISSIFYLLTEFVSSSANGYLGDLNITFFCQLVL